MRTAFKINASAIVFGALIVCGIASQQSVFAADVAPPIPPSAPTAMLTPASAPGAGAPLPIPATPKTAGATPNGALSNLEKEIPDSVKDIVKHLNKTTEDVTLDDLNTARQAVAKIEALIEIEKHLAELEKVRDEREKKMFAGAIPASALQPPVPTGMPVMGTGMPPTQMVMPDRTNDVVRIIGRNGHYSAVLKMSNDRTKTVQVGDTLPDGGHVTAITSTEVEVMHGTIHQTFHVKNVDTVYGNNPL